MAMSTPGYSISELSDRTAIPVRTIRSYIQQGLIPGPRSLGRGATYPETALDRLYAIKAYREVDGISLEQIRAKFLTISRREIAEKADPYRRLLRAGTEGSDTSALDYLTQLRASMGGTWTEESASPTTPGQPTDRKPLTDSNPDETPIDRALARIGALSGGGNTRRVSKADPWVRLPVNPDVELHVREAAVGTDIAKYELLVDYIREVLFGEDNN